MTQARVFRREILNGFSQSFNAAATKAAQAAPASVYRSVGPSSWPMVVK
jgi:hypothetical protein